MTNEEAYVLMFIPIGKENAIARSVLCASAGFGDRKIREIIEALRSDGYLICNLSDGKGYFLAANKEEANRYYWQEKNRLKSRYKSLKPFRDYLKAAGMEV